MAWINSRHRCRRGWRDSRADTSVQEGCADDLRVASTAISHRASSGPRVDGFGNCRRTRPTGILTRIIQTIRLLRPDVPVVLVAPTPYRSPYYPSNRHHAGASTAAHRLARVLDVGLVDPESAVLPGSRDGSANPDGMHWSWAAHRHVGRALAKRWPVKQR